MIYIVVAREGNKDRIIATKNSMDDALDVIKAMEDFDKAEALPKITEYLVSIVRKGG